MFDESIVDFEMLCKEMELNKLELMDDDWILDYDSEVCRDLSYTLSCE